VRARVCVCVCVREREREREREKETSSGALSCSLQDSWKQHVCGLCTHPLRVQKPARSFSLV